MTNNMAIPRINSTFFFTLMPPNIDIVASMPLDIAKLNKIKDKDISMVYHDKGSKFLSRFKSNLLCKISCGVISLLILSLILIGSVIASMYHTPDVHLAWIAADDKLPFKIQSYYPTIFQLFFNANINIVNNAAFDIFLNSAILKVTLRDNPNFQLSEGSVSSINLPQNVSSWVLVPMVNTYDQRTDDANATKLQEYVISS